MNETCLNEGLIGMICTNYLVMSHLKSLEPNKLQEYEMHFAKKSYTHIQPLKWQKIKIKTFKAFKTFMSNNWEIICVYPWIITYHIICNNQTKRLIHNKPPKFFKIKWWWRERN